jgi:hypothetical protein
MTEHLPYPQRAQQSSNCRWREIVRSDDGDGHAIRGDECSGACVPHAVHWTMEQNPADIIKRLKDFLQ